MPDQRTVEEQLTALAPEVAWPPTPDLSSAVGAEVRARPRRRPGWPWPATRRGAVLGLLAALLAAGAVAGAAVISLGGLRIVFGEPQISFDPGTEVERALGERVSLADARARADFDIRLPTRALGAPDAVYAREPPAGGLVALVWGERDGYPADPASGIALIVTQWRADLGPETFEKLVAAGTQVERVQVGAVSGYWIGAGEHVIYFRDAEGDVVETTMRGVGRVLLWEEGGLTLRVEGAPSLSDALAIAESLTE